MNIKSTYTSVKFLLNSIKCLGLKQGYRYWRIYEKAKKNPDLVKNWISNCEREASRLEFFQKEPEMSEQLRHWARTLRNYTNTNET